jgi:hypothetical protein
MYFLKTGAMTMPLQSNLADSRTHSDGHQFL